MTTSFESTPSAATAASARLAMAASSRRGCEFPENCPDCITREYVEKLAKSNSIKSASITHWPADLYGTDSLGEVRDDLVSGIRRGSFFEQDINKPKPTT